MKCSCCAEEIDKDKACQVNGKDVYHQDHLTCFTCGFKLNGRAFQIAGNIYCEIDFKRKFAPRCEECSDFIIGVRFNKKK